MFYRVIEHGSWLVVVLLVLAGCARIVATYPEVGQTYDEAAHLACGLEFLSDGVYRYEATHPPLARVAAAAGPYLAGLRCNHNPSMWAEGNDILHSGGRYQRNLALARIGMLPFFVIASLVVWYGTRHLFGRLAALIATAAFTALPVVLGHAAVVGNDMAVTAFVSLSVLAFVAWLRRPDALRGLALGSSVALALLSKFSAVIFLPACIVVLLAVRLIARPKGAGTVSMRSIALAAAAFFLVVWAGYRFSVTRIESNNASSERIRTFFEGRPYLATVSNVVRTIPVPAGDLPRGLGSVVIHSALGHDAYLMGEYRKTGWWYFFPVALAVKTPLALLVLALLGVGWSIVLYRERRTWELFVPIACSAAILLTSMGSTVNIGVRYILPIYAGLSVLAGAGAVALFRAARAGVWSVALSLLLLSSLAFASVKAHPDYFTYFNLLAGPAPEDVLVDSDLDWGQDLPRLGEQLRRLGVRELSISYHGSADLNRHDLPTMRPLRMYEPSSGWVAISTYNKKLLGLIQQQRDKQPRPAYAWLDDYKPVMTVGRTILLYRIPDIRAAQSSAAQQVGNR